MADWFYRESPGMVMLSFWRRLPTIVRAPIAGLAVAAAGTLPWTVLVRWNQRVWLQVPWALLPMSAYLWAYWKYLGGKGWPGATAEARRTSLRANRLPEGMWGPALAAGFVGLWALLPLLGVMSRMVRLPVESQPVNVPSQMPVATVFLLLVTASIVAGVVEEAAFRGYVQGPIERRHGLAPALLVTGALFGLGHFTHHPAAVLTMLPYYLAVAAVYGGLAWATNSILPGLVLHAGGDIFSLTRLWVTGRPEWQVSGSPAAPALIWNTGVDAGFLASALMLVVLAGTAIWAYHALARTTRAVSVQPDADAEKPLVAPDR